MAADIADKRRIQQEFGNADELARFCEVLFVWNQETEFVTMMWFTSLDAVRAFAGDDYSRAVVPPKAQALLSRYDDRSAHFDVRADRRTGA